MRRWVLAILAAAVLHAAILLFGGIFFLDSESGSAEKAVEEVDLLTVEDEKKDEQQPETVETPPEPPVPAEAPPDMQEIVEAPSQPSAVEDVVPRLDALSLAALSAALDGAAAGAGGGAFGAPVSLASGGRIGGTGLPGSEPGASAVDQIFDIGQLDQRPRPLDQTAPIYPRELRQRRIEGTVYVVFVVDTDGRVLSPVVEEATDEAFRGPAVEAVRRWRFEPAVVRGERVRSKLRVPIRFSLSN